MAMPTMAALPRPDAIPPKYQLQQGKTKSTLQIGNWRIETAKLPILNGKEIDAAEKSLSLPLPEMTFGNNSLTLVHDAGATIVFDTLSALGEVATGEGWEERVGGGVLVSMADKWAKRTSESAFADMPMSTKPVRPHDWTFSTTYAGHTLGAHKFEASTTAEIPLPLLARQDPVLDRILFYEDVALFEDELHDHGDSILHVRIRVMPHSFFILSRLFVRVDQVLFRIFDVRVFHSFESNTVIREQTGLEADYDLVKSYLEKPDDLSPLTDANWVYQTLKRISDEGKGGKAGKGKPWPGVGRRVEVLSLNSVDGASAGLGKLSL